MAGLATRSPEDQAILERAADLLNISLSTLLKQQEQAPPRFTETISATVVPPVAASTPRHEPPSQTTPQPSDTPSPNISSTTVETPQPRIDQFVGSPYNYGALVPWPNADASHFQDSDQIGYRNRLLNGFIPAGNPEKVARLQAASSTPPQGPDSSGSGDTHQNVGNIDLAAHALSALVDSSVVNISSDQDLTELESSSTVFDFSQTPNSDFSEWSLVQLPNAGSQSNEIVPMTFVAVNPLEPSTGTRQKRGPFQDNRLREETNKTRQLKACIRCRMQRVRCLPDASDPWGTCVTCQNVGMAQKIHSLPCLRYRLTECIEFRTGKAPGMEYSARWPVMKLKDITKWASSEIRTITVKSDVSPIPFDLQVRKFVPIPQDSLHRAWMDGKTKKFIETTTYAINDMKAAMLMMRRYITRNTFETMDSFLKPCDELIRMTFAYAKDYIESQLDSKEEADLLANYMKLWVAVRRTATLEHIVGPDKLDMVPEKEDKSYPLLGEVPLPPVMIQQLDIILTVGILLPLQKRVLEDMQKLILSNNPRTWMTMYLITFMSLHSCASLTSENYRNARRQGFRRRFSFPSFIQDRHHSANVFLSHYHYRTESCNPFKMDWKRRHATPFANMSTQDVIFLQKTQKLLEEKDRAESIRMAHEHELYENDLYFISQMYEENWTPRDPRIDYDGGTVHGGPVKKYYSEPVLD
ncbi:hypothetical protein OQA88_8447 [Cercophora sp. LCS_1]